MWHSSQPRKMNGAFNIAVSEFLEVPESANPKISPVASQLLFGFLDDEYRLEDFGFNVDISHERIGVISEAERAKSTAQSINADIVIYGDITVLDDIATMLPKFYINELYSNDLSEISGQHQLAIPLEFNVNEVVQYDSNVNTLLRERALILIEFTKS